MKFKALTATLLSVVIVLTTTSLAYADTNLLVVQTGSGTITVGDVSGDHWAAQTIAAGISSGIINGTGTDANGNLCFEPSEKFTRGQLAKLICLGFGVEPYVGASKQSFSDVTGDMWEYPYVEALNVWLPQNSVFGASTFRPAIPATREDVMVVAANALNLIDVTQSEAEEVLKVFKDWIDISYQIRPKVSSLIKMSIIGGYNEDDGTRTIRPAGNLTRAEAIVILERATRTPGLVLKNFVYPEPVSDSSFILKGETDRETRIWINSKSFEATVDGNGFFTSQPIETNFAEPQMKVVVIAEKGSAKLEKILLIPVSSDAPVIRVSNYPEITEQKTAVISGTVTGKNAIKNLWINDSKGNTQNVSLDSNGGFSYTATDLVEGPNAFLIKAENSLGNQTEQQIVITRNMDGYAPTIIIDTILPAQTNQSSVLVSGRASNAVELFNTMTSRVETNNRVAGFESNTGRFTITWDLVEGANTLTLKAISSTQKEVTSTLSITYRPEGPVIEIDSSVPPVTSEATYTVTGRVKDATELVDANGSAVVDFNPSTGRFSVTYNLKNGYNKFTLKAIGVGGTSTKDIEITRDSSTGDKPVIKLSDEVPANSNLSQITISGTVTDADILYFGSSEVRISEGGRFAYNWQLSQGENTMNITARNNAGDTKLTVSTTYNIMPRVTNLTNIPFETTESVINLNVQVRDAEKAYVNDVEVPIDNSGYINYSWNLSLGQNIASLVTVGRGTNNLNEINYEIYRDVGEPALYLIGAEVPARTEADTIYLNGRIRNNQYAQRLLAGDTQISFDSDGFFTYEWKLNMGVNDLLFTIAGENNKNTTLSCSTMREERTAIENYIWKFSNGGSTYYIFDNTMTWADAKNWCESKGGTLATLTSSGEYTAVKDALERYGRQEYYWLGGTCQYTAPMWVWTTGESWSFANPGRNTADAPAPWIAGQPCYNGRGAEAYLAMHRVSGLWNDLANNMLEYQNGHSTPLRTYDGRGGNPGMGFVLEIKE